MRRTAFIILAIAGGLTALVLIAVAIAVATVDLKTLVGPLQARVKAETGRDLAFGGPIDLKLSLQPKLVAGDVTLGNAAWAQTPQMLRAQRVEIQVALLPLLQRRFEVVELAFIAPVIALETDAKGRGNWEFGEPAASASQPASAVQAAGAGAIVFGNMAIENGVLTFRDGVTGKTTRVAIDHMAVRTRSGSAPIDAEFKGKIDDVAVAVSGNLGPLDALRERRWPYPVAIKGEIDGKPAAMSTKIGIQGDTTTFDALDFAWGRLAAKGEIHVVSTGGRRNYVFDLAAPSWSPADAAIAAGAALGARTVATSGSPPRFMFSERLLPLEALKAFDSEGNLAVAEIRIDAHNKLQSVKLKMTLRDGRLDVPSLQAAAYGGSLSGRATIDAKHAGAPAVTFRIDGRDLDLAAILAAAGSPRQIRGGKTTLTLDIAARGTSLHQWASTATGQALATVGATTLVNTKLDLDNVLDKLSQAINPFRERDPSTELVCGVIRLPLADGIAKVERSIAMETRQIGVSASGTVDFRDERLDLTLRPRIKEGIPLDIPQFAELVRFKGPFTHPAVSIDAVASATTIAKIGAAIGTGGLSVLGTSILAKIAEGGSPCEVALGRALAAKPAETSAKSNSPTMPNDIGKALGKLFGR